MVNAPTAKTTSAPTADIDQNGPGSASSTDWTMIAPPMPAATE